MDRYLYTAIYVIGIFCAGNCTSKRKVDSEPEFTVKSVNHGNRALCERKHFTEFSTNEKKCLNWPELREDLASETCLKFLPKLFQKKKTFKIQSNLVRVHLRYTEIENESGRKLEGKLMRALACRVRSTGGRNFYHFSRDPTPDCIFLLNRKKKGYINLFTISAEICEHHNYKFLKRTKILTEDIKKHNFKPDTNDDPEVIKQHEKNHWSDYQTDPNTYEEWPELKERKLKEYCRILLKQLMPSTEYLLDNITAFSEHQLLQYKNMKKDAETVFPSIMDLCALICDVSKQKKRPPNSFTFLRSPQTTCVYRVRKNHPKLHSHHIVKQVCENDVESKRQREVGNAEISQMEIDLLLNLKMNH